MDVIELDVLRVRGRLVLAHSGFDARRRPCLTLVEALTVLCDARFKDIIFNVDLMRLG